jgi:hypothetical protein
MRGSQRAAEGEVPPVAVNRRACVLPTRRMVPGSAKTKGRGASLAPVLLALFCISGRVALAQDPINEGNSNKAGIVPSDYIQSAEGAEDSKE